MGQGIIRRPGPLIEKRIKMPKTIDVVIGANFGDCGKGLMTDYLASLHKDCIIIRFNGGSQASHTVQTPGGLRHVFSHIGAGTYVGHPSYLSEFFIVNPLIYGKEKKTLIGPATIYVNKNCMVTTPFDMLLNQGLENARVSCGTQRHGSCGIGINETVTRCLSNPKYALRFEQLYDHATLMAKLLVIQREYMPRRMEQLGLTTDHLPVDPEEVDLVSSYLNGVLDFTNDVTLAHDDSILKHFDHLIFEGAQGLLLDEESQFFPHVTRSRTGLPNVIKICKNIRGKNLNVVYVSRWYLTRHGAGPLPFETTGPPSKAIVDKTNKWNAFQGGLRFAPLNMDLLWHAIGNDLKNANGIKIDSSVAFTCLDQIRSATIDIVLNGAIKQIKTTEFKKAPSIKYLVSGPTRDDVKENK
jgi:adenylosuccinate synthase